MVCAHPIIDENVAIFRSVISSSRSVILGVYFRARQSGKGPAKNLAFYQIQHFTICHSVRKATMGQLKPSTLARCQ